MNAATLSLKGTETILVAEDEDGPVERIGERSGQCPGTANGAPGGAPFGFDRTLPEERRD